jgi:hypothetical protein
MRTDQPVCTYVDLLDDCTAPVAAGLHTRLENVPEWFCAAHAVTALCERHPDALRAAVTIAATRNR